MSKRRWRHLGLARVGASRRTVTSRRQDHRILVVAAQRAIPRPFPRGSCTSRWRPDITYSRRVTRHVAVALRHVTSRYVTSRRSGRSRKRRHWRTRDNDNDDNNDEGAGDNRLGIPCLDARGSPKHTRDTHCIYATLTTSPGSSSRLDHGALLGRDCPRGGEPNTAANDGVSK